MGTNRGGGSRILGTPVFFRSRGCSRASLWSREYFHSTWHTDERNYDAIAETRRLKNNVGRGEPMQK